MHVYVSMYIDGRLFDAWCPYHSSAHWYTERADRVCRLARAGLYLHCTIAYFG